MLIACANVAGLLLVRATSRQREIAIRAALGAGRRRLIGQLLTESIVLSALGGFCGLLLAFGGRAGVAILSPGNIPRFDEISLDGRVLGFTLALSLLTSITFGLAPALLASRPDLNESLKESGTAVSVGSTPQLLRNVLVVGELALALVLLMGAGLMINSFFRLQRVELGFSPERVLTMRVVLPRSKYAEPLGMSKQWKSIDWAVRPTVSAFLQQALQRIEALPGVESAAVINHMPMSGHRWNHGLDIIGSPAQPEPEAEKRLVTPGYFGTMGIRLIEGRLFTAQDAEVGATGVAIVNRAMARRYWPHKNAVGKRLGTVGFGDGYLVLEIVGIVADTRQEAGAEAWPEMYVPRQARRHPDFQIALPLDLRFVVRTAGNPTSLARALRDVVREVDPDQPVESIMTMEEVVSRAAAPWRSTMLLLCTFAVLAVVLAVVGTYGVMSYAVERRTHEIGIRIALGAGQRDVIRLVMRQGMVLILAGLAIGLAAAFGLTRFLSAQLYGVAATDPWTFGAVSLVLAVVALAACYIPARRAAKVEPTFALRYE